MLNHIAVIQAAFGCLHSVSPTVVFSSQQRLVFQDTGVCVCTVDEWLCVFVCVIPLQNISVTEKLQLDLLKGVAPVCIWEYL